MKDAIDAGGTLDDLWDKHFKEMCKYRKSFHAYIDSRAGKRTDMSDVRVLWGPTGTGKTHRAHQLGDAWIYPGKGWFDGYLGQPVAIFDEFDGKDLPFSLWKQLCDKYPMKVPIKGAFVNWNPKIIVFTSNVNPDLWWGDDTKPIGWKEQYTRRVNVEEYLDVPYQEPEEL